ncbi:GGDEF domain-containing response regulator [Paracoccus benzoatiresistens]|uniref:diguanylate cyclase n=1 Tax=Paracoccus benzoatiresistens TaxID=2997341 RepID=A0ABT4JAV3_9RHOB|nr:diguanylate cyclase [Paracoccus sp. EF6]MCZ0963732.1 diguanylate cyclase [Paracoccus sp. EF6]
MTGKPTILVVDDEISNIEILGAILDKDYEVCFALSGAQALEVAGHVRPDLILLDIVMPGLDGYQTCLLLKESPGLSDLPVIFTTALDASESEVRGLSLGAVDYVTKPFQPVVLRQRIGNHIRLKQQRDQLASLAMTDPLTGLANRRGLESRLQAELDRLARTDGKLSVIMLDIDCFKTFNDSHGHPAGDRCLKMVGRALEGAVQRAGDLCARYGGEEFACILPGVGHGGAMHLGETIRAGIEALAIPHASSAAGAVVTASLGVASGNCASRLPAEEWILAADRMLYRSKHLGRNRVTGQHLGGSATCLPQAWPQPMQSQAML